MEVQYKYTEIDEKSKKFAIEVLNENPLQVNAHIECFRRWVKSMPHLQCPTDSKFLLRFLRVAKFDHEKAEKRLDNFCTMRTSVRGLPSYFKYYPIDDPKVETFLKMKIFIPLGRTDDGELFVLCRTREWNPDTFDLLQFLNMIFMSIDVLLCEEEIQIYGVSFLLDLDKVRFNAIEQIGNPKVLKNLSKIAQDSYPVRIRSQIIFKEPFIFEIPLKIALFFMKKKIASRIHHIRDDIEKAMKLKPGLEKLLPTEYNGLAGTLDECTERWNERFKRFHQNHNLFQNIAVNESKRPKKTLSYLHEYPDFTGQILGTSGTYTKFPDLF